jgi:hypothetical protein
VTGGLRSPALLPSKEMIQTTAVLDLIKQRNAANQIVYDHALSLAGVQAGKRHQLARSPFADQLVRAGNLLGGSAIKLRQTVGA